MQKIVSTENAPGAIGPYSQAVVAGGMAYCSGQIPIDVNTGEFVPGGIAEQTEQVLKNLGAVVKASGSRMGSVIKTTVFLADMADFAAMNEVYERYFGESRPARATVQAAGLPRGALVEIECVAIVES